MHDIAIIGGGVNGCGIARDAAGRGLSVLLVEQGDLASATSSASTKLVHGGLRYLEHYEFRLVREALAEREVLLRAAPHIIWPLRFVLPHHARLRPGWMIRAGLFLYDHLGGREILPRSRALDLRADPAGAPLQPRYTRGFSYADCWVDDARLVVLNARDAANRGATIRPRTRCLGAHRQNGAWHICLREADGTTREEAARILINAAGPWVGDVLNIISPTNTQSRTRLVKGSHIVVPQLFTHPSSYIFQNADGRICFAIPYEDNFTLIGTTDVDFIGDPTTVTCTEPEADYLRAAVNEYLQTPITPNQIVWRYAGVRGLRDDGAAQAQETTRDYTLELDAPAGQAPLLSVFGGKITTYRHLAESVLSRLRPFLPNLPPAWTAHAALPGGDFPWNGAATLAADLAARYPFLPLPMRARLARTHGTDVPKVLGEARSLADLGQDFGAGLTARELAWFRAREWATTAEDALWRRTKRGLHMTADQIAAVRAHIGA